MQPSIGFHVLLTWVCVSTRRMGVARSNFVCSWWQPGGRFGAGGWCVAGNLGGHGALGQWGGRTAWRDVVKGKNPVEGRAVALWKPSARMARVALSGSGTEGLSGGAFAGIPGEQTANTDLRPDRSQAPAPKGASSGPSVSPRGLLRGVCPAGLLQCRRCGGGPGRARFGARLLVPLLRRPQQLGVGPGLSDRQGAMEGSQQGPF